MVNLDADNIGTENSGYYSSLLLGSLTDYAICMLDPDGRVVSWNSGAERMTQYSADEIIGQHFGVLYPDSARENGEPARALKMAHDSGRFEAIAKRMRKDKTTFSANIVIHPVYDKKNHFVGYAKITRDISEQQRAEQKIHEGVMLKALVNTAVDGVIMTDGRGIISTFNPACEKLFGYQADEVLGDAVKDLMPPGYRKEFEDYLSTHIEGEDKEPINFSREVLAQRKDGTTFPMYLSVGEAKVDGKTIFVGIIHDLTDRKRTEEQLIRAQKMETVGQLSGGIAHDFNNLLTVIIGNADMLSDGLKARPDLKNLCDTIISAGERGAELTQRLLAFGRRQTLQPAVIDCAALVKETRHILERTISEDIEITTVADPDLAAVIADPSQLEAAILNLALNARDAMSIGGHITITMNNVTLEDIPGEQNPNAELTPGHYVMVAVTDDGAGISPEIREHVFEPFFTTKEVGKGSGLGLSMVYGFVKQSNGHVTIYSEPGLGTTVRLYLPAAHGAKVDSRLLRKEYTDTNLLRGNETILVTEDDPFVRSHAVASLEAFGYNVVTAANGQEALAKLGQDKTIDILFSDIVMPGGITGWDLCDHARKMRPDLKILLTSGYPVETLVARGRHDPSVALLNKPYRKTELGHKMREIINTKPAPARTKEEQMQPVPATETERTPIYH